MQNHFDLIVIGSGPGGQRAAVQAAKLSKSVLIVERDKMGGSCLHLGTVPSKTLREAVLLESSASPEFMRKVMERKDSVIAAEAEVIDQQLQRNKIVYQSGIASFVGPHQIEVRVEDKFFQYTADVVVLATGTRPRRSQNLEYDGQRLFDSDTILQMKVRPESLCVLGAGVIGCEYVSIFAHMGVQVTLLDRRADLLRGVDREIVEALRAELESRGSRFLLGVDFAEPKIQDDHIEISLGSGVKKFSTMLYCMGRIGNTEDLNLDRIGLKINERGLLSVNSSFQTRLSHVYAVGDLIGAPALAASASEQGRLAVRHAFLGENTEFPKLFPYGIYTIPEISSVGADEMDLQKSGIAYVVGKARYKELARGKILGDEFGFVKLLFATENRKLLGAHIIGTSATELIHLAQIAMTSNAGVDELLQWVFNYPTLAEAYKVAALNAANQFR